MAVFRVEKMRNYTVMSNQHLRDKRLSLKAKGLLSLMLSLPENCDYTTKGLARICKDGVDSICTTVRELEDTGYIVRKRERRAASNTPFWSSRGRTTTTISPPAFPMAWSKCGRKRGNFRTISGEYGDGRNPLVLKSEFIMSLCEQLMGAGERGAKEKSIMDRCTANIYRQCQPRQATDLPKSAPALCRSSMSCPIFICSPIKSCQSEWNHRPSPFR